jgi:general stress protein YciG
MDNKTLTVPPSPPTTDVEAPAKKKRGFAVMDRELVRELARRGGAAAHRAGTAHEFSREEAQAAGRKGGIAAHAKGQSS